MVGRQRFQKASLCGLTLIEVLIALSIVAIAITAIIKATTQNIRSTTYLENKMAANWVGQSILNQIKLGLITIANEDEVENETELLGKTWSYKAYIKSTANTDINKIVVDVYSSRTEDSPIITLESYVYHEPKPS